MNRKIPSERNIGSPRRSCRWSDLRAIPASTISIPRPDTPANITNAGACRALYHPGRPTWRPKTNPSVECAVTSSGTIAIESQKLARRCRSRSGSVSE